MLDFLRIRNNYEQYCLNNIVKNDDDNSIVREYIGRVKTYQPCGNKTAKGFFIAFPFFDENLNAYFYDIGIFEQGEKTFLNDLGLVKKHFVTKKFNSKVFSKHTDAILKDNNMYYSNNITIQCDVDEDNEFGKKINQFLSVIHKCLQIENL